VPNILSMGRAFMKDGIIKAAVLAGFDEASRRLLERQAGDKGDTAIVAVNYHSTPKSSADAFRRQLQWVISRFEVISFASFDRIMTTFNTGKPKGKLKALLTFDDGNLNNLSVAAQVLEEFDLQGLFFVVPGFHNDGRHISAEGICELQLRGHTVGCHTMTHAGLDETTAESLEYEIVASGRMLEEWIGAKVDTFAWTYSWNRISHDAWCLIHRHYRYCFTPCPGVILAKDSDPYMLWRTNVEADFSSERYRFMFSGLPSIIWARRRRWLEKMKNCID